MPKIYNTNFNPNHVYDKAEAFGDIVHMSRGYIPPSKLNKIRQSFVNYAKEASKEDYLLLSGSNLVCVLAVAAWLEVHNEVNLLQHTKMKDESTGKFTDSYIAFHVTTNGNESSTA